MSEKYRKEYHELIERGEVLPFYSIWLEERMESLEKQMEEAGILELIIEKEKQEQELQRLKGHLEKIKNWANTHLPGSNIIELFPFELIETSNNMRSKKLLNPNNE